MYFMKISRLKINHLSNPLGNLLDDPTLSFVVGDTQASAQKSARIRVALDEHFETTVYDSGDRSDIDSRGFRLPLALEESTRYYWKVNVTADNGETGESEAAWFETPKGSLWTADWISPVAPKEQQVCLQKNIRISRPVAKARMYMVGLGLYELYINGKMQGDECLLPGFCAYDSWLPFQTFEVDLVQGDNSISVMLGDGWYKGWYGLRQTSENYGDRLAAIAELHIWYEDGKKEVIGTDTSWKAVPSPVVYSGIYPGEVYDPGTEQNEIFDTEYIEIDKKLLTPRRNPRLCVHEEIRPIAVIHTPAGETVLDMGQNMVGWLQFACRAPKGTKLYFQFGEILQDGNFYNDNLRTAKAEFTYISDGQERLVRQHFTFYGFRYVKVTGWQGEPDLEDFRGLVIHSEMEPIGSIETSDILVNQLFHNAWWGMKGNFLDVPTDCPQRDERYGWTGDAQIFSGTACFNMDTYAFYAKYGYDIACEQKKFDGGVPDTVPVCNYGSTLSTAWGDAGTVIPWNVYLHSGDKGILVQQYDSMKGWVDYMKGEDDKSGGKRLWTTGFHYGDWLALDGNFAGGVFGATDPHFIASAYYYLSTTIVAKAAAVIGKEEDARFYSELAAQIREAFFAEYYSKNGRLCVDTMTAYVVALYMDLVPEHAMEAVREGLKNRLRRNRYHLDTGFVGTPYLCRVLSDNGMNDIAYHLLEEKGYPGWLYQITIGATTVWERWNSVLPNGKISGTGMNSLNHYSYGSIVEWMFRDMAGIQPCEDGPGFRHFVIAPQPNYRIGWQRTQLNSASGLIRSEWKMEEGRMHMRFTVPFNTTAEVILPDADAEQIAITATNPDGIKKTEQSGSNVCMQLTAGDYVMIYEPTAYYGKTYSLDTPYFELLDNPETRKIVEEEFFSVYPTMPFEDELYTFREVLNGPFSHLPHEKQAEIDERLRQIRG